jgi:hypothetical protein
MSNITPTTTAPSASTQGVGSGFSVDTSKFKLDFSIADMQNKVNDVTTRWSEDNMELANEAKMWQDRNRNVGKALEATEKDSNIDEDARTTFEIPTKNGKAIEGWGNMPDDQKEAMWKEAQSGYKYEKNSDGKWVMARDSNGQLIKSDLKLGEVSMTPFEYMKNYEGMTERAWKGGDGSNDTIRSRNQTYINNILTANSNKLSQATTKSNFGINQLQTSINTIQQLFTELFSVLKQVTNNTTA